jgi:Amt family ammonium transporter
MIGGVVGAGLTLGAASAGLRQAAMVKAPDVRPRHMVNKGDTTWMLVSSVLVLMMSVPGLALFYGGLVRTKNMLSVLMQVFMIVSIAGLLWATYGYSLAFTGGSPFIGELRQGADGRALPAGPSRRRSPTTSTFPSSATSCSR